MWVLGIAGSHDGAHCLIKDGRVVVAIREERLTGLKRARVHSGRGGLGLRYCLDAAGIGIADLAVVVAANQQSTAHADNDLALNPDLRCVPAAKRMNVSHHLAHAASVVACSGFQSCAVMVCDGVGSPVADLDRATRSCVRGAADGASEHMTLYHSVGVQITPLEVHVCRDWIEKTNAGMWRFHTLGGLFSAVAQQIFGNPNDAGKVMGLAPYGKARFAADEFLRVEDGALHFTNTVQRHFRGNARWPQNAQDYRDLAASAQAVLEDALLHFVRDLRVRTQERQLCFAGGVALNSVANERILRESGFDDMFVIPAADDAGTAIGAAYLGYWASGGALGDERLRADFHGHCAKTPEIRTTVKHMPDLRMHTPSDLLDKVTMRLERGEIGGWMQNGAEFGPRALGERSIIASPIGGDTKDRVNAGVKFRESFRPFAPAVLKEYAAAWFAFGATPADSPFMLRVVDFRQDRVAAVPAVVHVDGTGRLQTLTRQENGRFHDLVERFFQKTGVPILLNTSMNLRDEPIVETVEDALWMLLGTELTFCVINGVLITKGSGARGVLDHVPSVAATEWTMRLGVTNGRLNRAIDTEDGVRLGCDTPWGRSDLTLPIRLAPVLSAIDGVSTGRALHGALTEKSGEPLSETQLIHDLLLLRRMKAIRLEVPR